MYFCDKGHFNRLHVLHVYTWVEVQIFQTLEMQILKIWSMPTYYNLPYSVF